MAHQLTIRYDETLAREIEDLARREGLSRNQAVLRLLRKAAGLEERSEDKAVIGGSLDWFFGSWTEEQAREFDEAQADFETIDEDLWIAAHTFETGAELISFDPHFEHVDGLIWTRPGG